MRAGETEATGTSGESEVLAQFEKMGWGAVLDSRHDTGTDLYLRPRDERRFELLVVMGAQVKTGPSYFNSPMKDDNGEVVGWWFSDEDRKHIDYWLRHALPHLLILRSQDDGNSYWVHVTSDAVKSTGKGAKILVPRTQTIGKASHETLTGIALSRTASYQLNGTAWTGAPSLLPHERIRYALVVPRIVAPHPNLAPRQVEGFEALAMQSLIRRQIERILAPGPLAALAPTDQQSWSGLLLAEAKESDDWAWRATAALHVNLYHGNDRDIHALRQSATTPSERAAAAVLSVVQHFAQNDPDSALRVLEESLSYDDYEPVDFAWLRAQQARASLEIGERERAFDLAISAQRISIEKPNDATAAAIAGSCARTAFDATGWMQGDIGKTVMQNDNPATWWRTQVISRGLSAHLDEQFFQWTRQESIRFGHTDEAAIYLTSAALLASCAADHAEWRRVTRELAHHIFTVEAGGIDAAIIATQLRGLRRSGDQRSASAAVRRVIRDGPIQAAAAEALIIAPENSTRTSASADLEFLISAGDVLTQARSDQLCDWVLGVFNHPAPYLDRVNPTFSVRHKLMKLLTSLIDSMSDEKIHSVIDFILNLPKVGDGSASHDLAELVHRIPQDMWFDEKRVQAGIRADTDGPPLRDAYIAIAADAVPDKKEVILARATRGDLTVFDAIDDVRSLTPAAVNGLADELEKSIDQIIADAAEGSASEYSVDRSEALTLLNVWHPNLARWGRIIELLTNKKVQPRQKRSALRILATQGERAGPDVKVGLLEALKVLLSMSPPPVEFTKTSIRGLTTEAMASLADDAQRAELVLGLLAGETDELQSASRIVGRFGMTSHVGSILALASGAIDPLVRAEAGGALCGLLVNDGVEQRGVIDFLVENMRSGGRRVAAAIAAHLGPRSLVIESVAELLELARSHPSAMVRKAVQHGSTNAS